MLIGTPIELPPEPQPEPNPWELTAQALAQLPDALTTARTEQGLTLTTAAKQIGIGSLTLANLEARASNPTLATVTACVRWLAA